MDVTRGDAWAEPQAGDVLLIAALRRMASGQSGCALTRRDFAIAFPGDADEVFATFRASLQALARAGRRKLRVGLPAMPDEIALVALLAAAQAGDDALFDAHLRWLTRPDARDSAAITTRALAAALAVHGHWLRAASPCHCERREAISRRSCPRRWEIASSPRSSPQ